MGGHGSGGGPSVGRKPDEAVDDSPVPEVEPPAELSAEQLAIWQELAPFARAKRTLLPETARRFRLLCRAMVMEASMADKIAADGWTYLSTTVDGAGNERETLKAHPLLGAQRAMMQRIEAGLVAFRLAPIGKPLGSPPQKRQSALERLQSERPSMRAVK